MQMKSIYVTGYRPHELGIFNDKHPGVEIIKKAIEQQLRVLIDDGLEWVIISGQQGVETWAIDVVMQLKVDYPYIKYSVITPFLDQQKNWNEVKQMRYDELIAKADYVTSITKRPYEAAWQFIEKDKFIIDNTDGILLVYDEDNEASPKYVLNLVEKYQEKYDYTLFKINAYDLQMIAEEMQRGDDW